MERSNRANPLDPLGQDGSAHRIPPPQQQQPPPPQQQQQQQKQGPGFLETHEALVFYIHVVVFVLIALLALRIFLKWLRRKATDLVVAIANTLSGGQNRQKIQ
jgi:hypothetical protein